MRMLYRISVFVGPIVGALSPAWATEPPPVYTMTTPIPRGIEMPDSVETRLGTLRFFDGFPDDATVETIYDNLDFQRAVQAYLLGLAPVSQLANRKGIEQLGPINTTVPIFEDRMDSKSLFLTPNNNTPYTWLWLDLRGGPLVLEVPPKVLGAIDDMWYGFVTDLGFTGPDKGQGGKYLLLPPGHEGDVPQGYFVVRPATYSVWAPMRSFLVDGDPKPGVDLVKQHTKIYRLIDAGSPPTLRFVNVSGREFSTLAPADYTFWEYLNQVVQEEPTESLDPVTLGMYASIGIEKGKPFAPDSRMRQILTEAAVVGDATARTINSRLRIKESYFYPGSAWRSGFYGGYRFEENGARILDAYSAFFFYATGVTPAMDSRVVGEGSQYMGAFVDANEQPLDGGRSYRLHLPPGIPVKQFWSAIVYDNQTRSMLQTDQRWPSVTSQNSDLRINADGSVDVFFGPEAPAGMESNWIQTIPGKGWNILLRLYGPLEPWFDKTWRPSEIQPLD